MGRVRRVFCRRCTRGIIGARFTLCSALDPTHVSGCRC
jgi:hypothetical protein